MTKNFLDLEIPYGLHPQGYLIRADEAEKQVQYYCPACEKPLVFRAGEYMVKHFAHMVNTQCSGESIIHKTAKMLIAQAISEQADATKKRTLNLQCTCKCCNSEFVKQLPHGTFTSSHEEKSVGNYICDLVAQKEGQDVLAIEIFHTHKVDNIKAKNLSLHWIELSAESVLNNPYYWQPTQVNLKVTVCEKCKKHIRKLKLILNKWNVGEYPAAIFKDPSRSLYLAEIETCFKCKQEIPVFWWNGVPFCESAPPEPKPKTIAFKYSKSYEGSYWANTCANCGATQGDNFLFLGFNKKLPIFKSLPLRETKEMKQAGKNDMDNVIKYMLRNF